MVIRGKFRWWMGALAALLSAASPALGDLYTDGHADIGVGYEGGALELHFHADDATINGVPNSSGEYEPGDITTVVPQKVYAVNHINKKGTDLFWSDINNVPESLGLRQGDKFWNLPEAKVSGAPWLGIGTEEIDDGIFRDDTIRLTLSAMVAPTDGHFSLWNALNGVAMTSYQSIVEAEDFIDVPTGAHTHWNYAFSKPGDYYLTFKAYGTLDNIAGDLLESSGTYHFQVVPEPSSLALAGIGLGSCLSVYAVRRRRAQRVSGQKA